MHISITGMLGSGKSTISRIISDITGYELYSTGTIQRHVAEQKGVTTLELNRQMHNIPELDTLIDGSTEKISVEKADTTVIFDSRMAWFFAKNSYRVFIAVDPYIGAKRVYNADRGKVEGYLDIFDAKQKLSARAESEHERFKRIYDADYWDYDNYDLVIDATWHDAETLAYIILGAMDIFLHSKNPEKSIMMSPRSLYPGMQKDRKRISLMRGKSGLYTGIVIKNHYHYIVNGYSHVKNALTNKTELINVKNLNKHMNTDLSDITVDEDMKKEFEKAGNFSYVSSPDV